MLTLLLVFAFISNPAKSFAANSDATKALETALSEVEPFAFKKKTVIQGINYDLLRQIESKAGLKFNYGLYPHFRLTTDLGGTRADVAIMFETTCQRQPTYEVQSILYSIKPTLYLKEPLNLKSKDLRVGLIRGTCTYVPKKVIPAEMVTEINDMSQGIDMIRAGRLDGVCGLKPVVEASLSHKHKLPVKLVPHYLDEKMLRSVVCVKKTLPTAMKRKLELGVKDLKIPTFE